MHKAEKTDWGWLLPAAQWALRQHWEAEGASKHEAPWPIKHVHEYSLTLQPCETAVTVPRLTREGAKLSKG